MAIDFNTMTLNEIEEIELLTNKSIDSIMDDGAPKGRVFKAIIFVMTKRTNPDFTLEQAGKLSMDDAAKLFGDEDTGPKA
jgi:hypothetical protein